MYNINDFEPGMRVRIVDSWGDGCWENGDGLMDKWLGQVMTVSGKYDKFLAMVEDAGECQDNRGLPLRGWYWTMHTIAEIVPSGESDFDVPAESLFSSFIWD